MLLLLAAQPKLSHLPTYVERQLMRTLTCVVRTYVLTCVPIPLIGSFVCRLSWFVYNNSTML